MHCPRPAQRYGIRLKTLRACLLASLLVLPAGCDPDTAYLISILGNTVRSYGSLRPIDAVLADGSVTPEQADKLRLVQRMRIYAEQHVGLTVGDAYSQYQDNGNGVIGYALLASHPDRFLLYRFAIPLFGPADTKVFYDRPMADAEAARLKAEGYDVFLTVVEGFSTLGVLSDPIRTSNLEQSEGALAELVFHELLHNTVYKPNDPDFNESMATFVGRTAAQAFFADELGPDSPISQAAVERNDDQRLLDPVVEALYHELLDLYAQPIDREAKLAAREEIFAATRVHYQNTVKPQLNDPSRFSRLEKFETNNAGILANIRYQGGLDLFRQVYDASGQDFPATLDVLRQAADRSDSRGFLADWLTERGIVPIP